MLRERCSNRQINHKNVRKLKYLFNIYRRGVCYNNYILVGG
jgi:hypothetical protein